MKPGAALSPIIERIAILGEPARLRALCVLEREELSVGELSRVLQAPQSTVSRHLKLLAGAGWVQSRTERTATYYRVSLDDLGEADRAMWTLLREQVWGRGEVAADARRLAEVLADRQTDSLTFFGRVAGEWDSVRHDLFGDRFTSEALLSLIRPDWVVADVGCGTGNVASLVAPVVEQVIAVDQSGPMLDAARQRLDGAGNVGFEQGAIESLPMDDGSVDAVVCALVLHHVDEVVSACAELSRVLRTDRAGGVAIIIDMYEHEQVELRLQMGHRHMGFEPSELEQVLRQSGFRMTRLRALACGAATKGPGLFALSAWK